jgi:hypothetical protein
VRGRFSGSAGRKNDTRAKKFVLLGVRKENGPRLPLSRFGVVPMLIRAYGCTSNARTSRIVPPASGLVEVHF